MATWVEAANGQVVNVDRAEIITDAKRPFAYFSDGSEIELAPYTDGVHLIDAVRGIKHFVPALESERATIICQDGTRLPMHLIGWRVQICGVYSYAEPLVAGSCPEDGYFLRTDRDGSSALSRFLGEEPAQPARPFVSGTRKQIDEWVTQWFFEEAAK